MSKNNSIRTRAVALAVALISILSLALVGCSGGETDSGIAVPSGA